MEAQVDSEIRLDLGIMADGIEQQLNEQGYTLGDKLSKYEKIKDSIYMLSFHEYITDLQKDEYLNKFMADMMGDLEIKE